MKTTGKLLLALSVLGIFLFGPPRQANAQNDYSNYDELTQQLKDLESNYSDFADLQSLTTTLGDRHVWMLTLGSGDIREHPAVAVIGGAKGSHLLGSELALEFAENILTKTSQDSIRKMLESTTFYVVPRLNPDAAEQLFADLKYARDGNAKATDEDRDGPVNEDGFEDLNGDGLITMMRVEDQAGKWIPYPKDERVMVKADINDGQKGSYQYYTEGRDNDHDGEYNEDGEGGVNLNKNFTFDYPNFTPGAGPHMASEKENRALMDFLYEKGWNVFTVMTFGPANNLSTPVSFNPGGVKQRVITSWFEDDIAINKYISKMYKETISLKDAPKNDGDPGDLFQWGYFHYGRFSFSTPGWWTPVMTDSADNKQEFKNDKAEYLAWADQNDVDAFVEWTRVDHPDFPNRTVEVGGIKPGYMINPPYEKVDSLAKQHTNFLVKLAKEKPTIKLINFATENAGTNLTRINVDVYNDGVFPTASKIGERNRWVRKVEVNIDLGDGLSLVSGDKVRMIDSIGGDNKVSMSWLIRGDGDFSIKAGAPITGFSTVEQTIN